MTTAKSHPHLANTVFHIGLHKTGTTFLQRSVFPVVERVNLIRDDLYDLLASPGDKLPMVSYESLSGHPWQGKWLQEFEEIVHNIGSIFPKARCIIGFRRHDRLVKSIYKQYLQQGNTGEFNVLFSPDGSGLIDPADLSFRRRLRLVNQHFSKVLVYTQERLKANLETFLERLGGFLNVDRIPVERIEREERNVGVKTNFQVNLLRTLNRVDESLKDSPMPTLHNWAFRTLGLTPSVFCQRRLRGVGRTPFTLPEGVATYLRDRFAEDWEYVQKSVDR